MQDDEKQQHYERAAKLLSEQNFAAAYTIGGCILGIVFMTAITMARATVASPIDVLRDSSFHVLAARAISSLSFVDFVYWFVAVFVAVFLARRPLARADRLAIGLTRARSRD